VSGRASPPVLDDEKNMPPQKQQSSIALLLTL